MHIRRPTNRPLFAAAVLVALALAAGARAEWPDDPLQGVPLSLATGAKYDVFAVSDGCGGAIVVWEDERTGEADVYAQRVDVSGNVLWQAGGVPVCTAPGDQEIYHSSTGTTGFTPVLADGDGGAWIVWQDGRFFGSRLNDVYLQRLDADGEPHLATNGVAVAARPGMEDQPTLCADGAGGVFVVWQDKTADPVFYDLHGQRVGPDGALLWNGGAPRPLVVRDWDQDGPTVCPDGAGGFYLAWSDALDDVGDVYAQRFGADGAALWTAGGVAVAAAAGGQDAIVIRLAADGQPLLAWVDRRGGAPDIYAQKLDPATGAARWAAGGLGVCTGLDSQYRPALAPDAAGGAYVAWFDYRNASGPPWNLDIFAQRIEAAGTVGWTANGALVCGAQGPQRDVSIAADGLGGVLLAWEDDRTLDLREDIYGQRLDAQATPLWQADGAPLCTAAGNQERPAPVAGAGGLLAAWPDDRDVLYEADVYAGRLPAHDAGVCGVNRVLFDLGAPATVARDTFVVSNVGLAPYTVADIAVDDPAGPFSATPSVPLPAALAPGEAFQVVVAFDPVRARDTVEVTGEVRVTHDAPFGAPQPAVVRLRGEAAVTGVPGTPPRDGLALVAAPSPFNPRTTVRFTLPAPGAVTLQVHDLAGRRVRTLVADETLAAGPHAVRWDGRDDRGRALPSGGYLLRLRTAAATAVRQVVLVR